MAGIRVKVVISFMLALAFSFSVFLLWTLVGRAVLALVSPRFGVLRAWLLAPGLGLSIILITLMVGNQAGWPIGAFARVMPAAWVVLAIGVLLWRRPVWSPRALVPFFGAALFSLLWTGWPALSTGFNWISYGNDDMANYCLAAERFADHDFYAVPTMAELSGRDYTSYYFFMHVADMMRFGAEHTVAWVSRFGGLKATQGFMPAILALSLVQLFSAAGLALQLGRHRRRALIATWVLAASPLFLLGTLYQLIAQVGGIALQLVVLALMARLWSARTSRTDVLRHAVLCAIAGTGLCLYYPETTPFTVVTYLGFCALALVRRRITPTLVVSLTAYTLLGVVLLLRHNLISFVSVLIMQLTSALHSANLLLSLFPYFLLPTGFSNLFGWMPIAKDFAEPVLSLSIMAGMLFAVVVVGRALRESWRLNVAALLLLVQAAVAVKFYFSASDFNLYKLAMWLQPALAIALAGLALKFRRPALLVLLFALTTAPSALHYARAAEGTSSGGMTELRYASRLGLAITPPTNPDAQITATIENVVAAKFAGSEMRGHQLAFASRDYFTPNTRIDFRNPPTPVTFQPHYADMAQARPLMLERNEKWVTTSTLWRTEFSQPVLTRPTDYYLDVANQLSLFNKFGRDPDAPVRRLFELQPAAGVRNRLVFVHSGLGNHYYLGNRGFISFFQQEPDQFAPGRDFNGIGHFMLFRVEHPSEEIYLRIAATRTLLTGRTGWRQPSKNWENKLVGPVVRGAGDVPIPAIGHGAFNLFVGPLHPLVHEGVAYVAVDFWETPDVILDRRTGLKRLYNSGIPLDYRRVLGWGRDISAVSAADYEKLSRPLRLAHFPDELSEAETLEFSGAYEDGWLSPQSTFVLGATAPGGVVRLRGFVPELPGSPLGRGTMKISVDGTELELPAATGTFDWLLPVPALSPSSLSATTHTTRVAVSFTATTRLPGGDDRPTGGKLETLEVLPALPTHTFDFGTPGALRVASTGIDQDGWMERTTTIVLPASPIAEDLALRIEYPNWTGAQIATLLTKINDDGPRSAPSLNPGEYANVRIHVPASVNLRIVHLALPADYPLPAPDTRRRAARLLQADLTPAPKPPDA